MDSTTAQLAHHLTSSLPAVDLLRLAPDLDHADLFEVRRVLAAHLLARSRGAGQSFDTWQAVWNDLVGAGPRRVGTLTYMPARCGECRGRRITMRTGTVCPVCVGTGRPRSVRRVAATWASPPAPSPDGATP